MHNNTRTHRHLRIQRVVELVVHDEVHLAGLRRGARTEVPLIHQHAEEAGVGGTRAHGGVWAQRDLARVALIEEAEADLQVRVQRVRLWETILIREMHVIARAMAEGECQTASGEAKWETGNGLLTFSFLTTREESTNGTK